MNRKLLSLLVLLLLAIPVATQESSADLIAYFNQELYILEGDALVPYDTCMPDEEIVGQFNLSPDSSRILMATFPKIISEALALVGSLGDAPLSLNLWICDTTTDTLDRIIALPGGDEAFAGDLPAMNRVASPAKWSPDSTQLAWTELNFEDVSQSVVIFDIATGERRSFLIDVPLAPFPAPPELIAWTDAGMLLWLFEFDEETFFNIETLLVLDPETEGIVASHEILNGGESDDFYNQRDLVQTPGGLKYVLEFQNQGRVLVDIATGDMTPTIGRLARTVPGNPDSIVLQYEIDFSYNYNWQFETVEGTLTELRAYPPNRIALSSDGTELAYADSTLHIVNSSGAVRDIANSDGFADDFQAQLLWGADSLVFVELLETELAPPSNCEGAPPIQLIVGNTGHVISQSIPNRIRSLPSIEGAIVSEIPGGGEFIVRDGPVCAEGYTWFQIEYNGIVGWTVEGRGESYFLEPITGLP